jgi:hypothetical protein
MLAGKIIQEASYVDDFVEEGFIDKLKQKYGVKKQFEDGIFGTAWITNDNTVIKVTSDTTEARLCHQLAGKDMKHYANIYAVYKYNIAPHKQKPLPKLGLNDTPVQNVYIIEKELLAPLTSQEEILVRFCWKLWGKVEMFKDKIKIFNSYLDRNAKGFENLIDVEGLRKMFVKYHDMMQSFAEHHMHHPDLSSAELLDASPANIGKKPNGDLAGYDFRIYTDEDIDVSELK